MFENPRRGRQARNFTTNVPKILDLNSSSEQIFSENCRWVPLVLLPREDQTLLHVPEKLLITKPIYQLSLNKYNKTWLNTNLPKTPNLFTVEFR